MPFRLFKSRDTDLEDLMGAVDILIEKVEFLMGDTTALNAIVTKLDTDVNTLISSIATSGSSDQAAIDAATASLTTLDNAVTAATPAAPA
jgi:hypothetical protein